MWKSNVAWLFGFLFYISGLSELRIEHEQLLILLGSLELNCFCKLRQGVIWLVINGFQHDSNWFLFLFLNTSYQNEVTRKKPVNN